MVAHTAELGMGPGAGYSPALFGNAGSSHSGLRNTPSLDQLTPSGPSQLKIEYVNELIQKYALSEAQGAQLFELNGVRLASRQGSFCLH